MANHQAESKLIQRVTDSTGHFVTDVLDIIGNLTLDHNSDQRLGTGGPKQNAPSITECFLGSANSIVDGGVCRFAS